MFDKAIIRRGMYWVFGCIIFTSFLHANLIVNPGFDMDPWYTGWEGDTNTGLVEPDSTDYISPSNSCHLRAYSQCVGPYSEIYQMIKKVVNCSVNVYYKYDMMICNIGDTTQGECRISIALCINGDWREIYSHELIGWGYIVDTLDWTELSKKFSSTDIISGIKFTVEADGPWSDRGPVASVSFWIDDVYIDGDVIGVEEAQILNNRQKIILQPVPNPFISRTTIWLSIGGELKKDIENQLPFTLSIYDLSGRIVRFFNLCNSAKSVVWDGRGTLGKEVKAGTYFCKLKVGDKILQTKKLVFLK
jgi:hypothetical protein